jgi:hypothetical protein
MRKKQAESISYRPFIALTADDLVDAVVEASPSRDFIFDLIVKLEKACMDGDFLERVWKHFDAELKKQQVEQS